MGKRDLMALAEEERSELLGLLGSLTATQWDAPSLCSRWRVRDVAIHVVSYDELSVPRLAATFLRGGLRVSDVNDMALKRYGDLAREGILDLVSRSLRPRGLTSGLGGGIALTDGTIHHQDIRRALGLPRAAPASRLPAVLDFALGAPTLPVRKNARGLRLIATDIDWSTGDGPEVTGPGEALLMSLAGRPQAVDELGGPGLATLRSRIRQRGAA